MNLGLKDSSAHSTPSTALPAVEEDLRYVAGVVRLLAGIALLAWVVLFYLMPLAGLLLQLSFTPGAVAAGVAATGMKVVSGLALCAPGLLLVRM